MPKKLGNYEKTKPIAHKVAMLVRKVASMPEDENMLFPYCVSQAVKLFETVGIFYLMLKALQIRNGKPFSIKNWDLQFVKSSIITY